MLWLGARLLKSILLRSPLKILFQQYRPNSDMVAGLTRVPQPTIGLQRSRWEQLLALTILVGMRLPAFLGLLLESSGHHFAIVSPEVIVRHLLKLVEIRRVFREFEQLRSRRLGMAFHRPLQKFIGAREVAFFRPASVAEVGVAMDIVVRDWLRR